MSETKHRYEFLEEACVRRSRGKLVIWFEDLRKGDTSLVGGKNANLGEMLNAGIPVPPGFAVTVHAYKKFVTQNGLLEKIIRIIETVTNMNNLQQFQQASKEIRKLVESTPIPRDIDTAIKKAYNSLGKRNRSTLVAARSSATTEDLHEASFAGQHETYLNIASIEELLEKIIKCWSSLFTPRAIFYRAKKGFKHKQVPISVGVQRMVNAKTAGVMFTINPLTGESNNIVIEANWGIGLSVVSGYVTPDSYIVDKKTLKILEKTIARKKVEYIREPKTGKTIQVDVPAERQEQQCLTDEEIAKLAELAKSIEEHYHGHPQDIEFAIDRDISFPENVFIVQSRPETLWSRKLVGPEGSQ